MDTTKQKDIFAVVLGTPDVNVFDLQKSNITPENTSLLDKDTYKDSDFVKKYFTDQEGKFDEDAFNNAYLRAANLYTESSNDKYLANALEWDASDVLRPVDSKIAKNLPVITKDLYNPSHNVYSRTSLNSIDKGALSSRELAQKQNVVDFETGKELDYTPNDLGYLGALTNETMVYAAYDEDGFHSDPFSGRQVAHKKGERKLNKKGEFYVETLGNREVYGKEVVNPSDLITTDGSAWNSVDFFDSDGLHKSTTGTIMKTAFEIAPYLIPGFNAYYGAFKAAEAMATVMPTLYKAMEGVALGDSTKGNETELWKAATKAEGFMARFNASSYSDDASSSMFNKEQLASMVGSIFGQIYEQRAVASLSKMFYKVNDPEYVAKLTQIAEKELTTAVKAGAITSETTAKKVGEAAMRKVLDLSGMTEKQSHLAAKLSTAYMAITSTANIYEDALAAGYDRRTAGLGAFAAMLGQYGIMGFEENRMQTWFLDKGVGFDDVSSARNKVIKPILDDIEKSFNPIAGNVSKEAQKKTILNRFNDLKTFFSQSLVGEGPQSIYKNALTEGVQEVVEQSVLDATKGMIDALSYFGFTEKKGSFNTIQETFSEKGVETYLSNLLGGMIGGAMFEVNRLKIEPLFNKNSEISPEVKYSLQRMVANGDGQKLKTEAAKMVKAMGNTGLSPVTIDINGEKITLGTDDVDQANLVLATFNKYIDHLEGVMNSENLLKTDEDIIRKTILDEIREDDIKRTGVDKFILSDVNELTADIISLKTEISQLDKEKDSARISELMKDLGSKRDEFNSIISGEKAQDYLGLSIFALNSALHSPFQALSVQDYAKSKYNTNYSELPETGGALSKTQIENEFRDLMSKPDDNKSKIKFMYSAYKTMLEKYSNLIGEYGEENHIQSREGFAKLIQDSKLINADNIFKFAEAAKYFNIKPNLDDKLDIPLGNVLLNNNKLDTRGLSEEEINKKVETLNRIGKLLPFRNVSTRMLSEQIRAIISEENARLDGTTQPELSSIQEERNQLEANKNNISYSEYLDKSRELNAREEDLLKRISEAREEISKSAPKLISETDEELPVELMYFVDQITNQPAINSNLKNLLNNQKDILFDPIKRRLELSDYLYTDIEKAFPEELPNGEPGYLTTPELLQSVKQSFKEFKLEYDDANSIQKLNDFVKKVREYVKDIDNVYKATVPLSVAYNEQEAYDFSMGFFKEGLEILTANIQPIESTLLEKADNLLSKPVMEDKFYKLLEQIHLDVFRGGARDQVKILKVIQDEINQFEKDSTAPQNYVRTQNVIKDLEEARDTLNLVKSLTVAMLDSSEDSYSPYSFSSILQNVAQKNGEDPSKYKTINGQTYNLLNKELNNFINKVEFLIDLAKTNSGTIWKNEEEIKDSTLNLRWNILTNSSNPSSPLNMKINGKDLLTPLDVDEIKQMKISQEEKIWELENTIYNNFNSEYVVDPESALEQLHSYFIDPVFIRNLAEIKDSGLYKNQEKLSDYDYFIYLHTILAVKNKDFYTNYKNILEKELTLQEKKVPFFSQENTIRTVYSYIKGKEIMNSVNTFITKHINTNPQVYRSNRAIMDNLFFVIGSGGVGKTSVISNYLARMLDSNEFDKYVSATDKYVLDKLHREASRNIIESNTVNENNKLGKITEFDLLKLVLNNDLLFTRFNEAQNSLLTYIKDNADKIVVTSASNDVIDNHSFPETNSVIKVNTYTEDDIKLTQNFIKELKNIKLAKKTVIFADEVSYFSPLALQVLSTIASNEGSNLYFIGSGDNLQDSFVLSEDNPFSLDHFHFISPPRLKGVIRGKNIHKKDNNENLEILVKKLINQEEVPESVKVLTYYQTTNSLQGDKLTDTLNQADLESLDQTLETAVITQDGTLDPEIEDKFKKAGFDISKLKVRKRTDVKGEEFDQVISLVNLPIEDNNVAKSVAARRFYTLLTRAKVATIVVENKEVIDVLGIKNEKRNTTSSVELNSGDIDSELSKRFDALNQAFNIEETPETLSGVIIPDESIPESEEDTDIMETQEPLEETNLTDSQSSSPEIFEEKVTDKDGFMTYSFANILHADINESRVELKPLEGNEIPSDLQILNILGLRNINDILENRGQEIVDNFIQMKNILLHRFVAGYNDVSFKKNTSFSVLNDTLLSDGKLVLRKLKVDNKYIQAFGKQAHKLDEEGKARSGEGKEYLYLAYKGNYNGKDFYITLAALPDPESINTKFNDKKNLLNKFYNTIPLNSELEVKGNNILNVYSGIGLFNEKGELVTKGSQSNVKIEANNLNDFVSLLQRSRGLMVKVSDKIEVFSNDKAKTSKIYNSVGYKKPKDVDTSNFAGRPYLQVSYVDPNNPNVSKLIVLNPKQRTLKQAINDYKGIVNNPSRNNSEFLMLISQYDGLDLLFKLPKTDQNKIISEISNKKYSDNLATLKSILNKSSIKDVPISQFKKLIENGFPNLGLKILDAIYTNKIKVSEDLLNTVGYYNQKYWFKKGESGEMYLPGDYIKYFSFNYYLEPPKFLLFLGNIELEENKEIQTVAVSSNQPPATENSINLLGTKVEVDFSKWSTSNPKPLQKATAVVSLATEKLNKTEVFDIMGANYNSYKNLVLNMSSEILKDPNIVNINNSNFNTELIDNKIKNYFEINHIFSENSLGFSENQLDYIMNNFVFNSNILNKVLINYNIYNKDNDSCK